MVMKAFSKTILRMFKENKGRFIANFLIVFLSVAITAGFAFLVPLYEQSYLENYQGNHTADIILKDKTANGFSLEDMEKVKKDSDVEGTSVFMCADYECEDPELGPQIYRFYIMDLQSKINELKLESGVLPTTPYDLSKEMEVITEVGNANLRSYDIGEKIIVGTDMLRPIQQETLTLKVVGIVNNPLYNSVQKENATVLDENHNVKEDTYIDAIIYLDRSLFPTTVDVYGTPYPVSNFLLNTDMYVTYKEKSAYFSDAYEQEMNQKKDGLISLFGEGSVAALTLEENISYSLFKNYNSKVKSLSIIFPFFFILVCALVNLITITRLIKDERPMIATYVSLGVSKAKIVLKYILFTLISTLFGSILGLALGSPILPSVVLPAYGTVFQMHPLNFKIQSPYAYIVAILVVLTALGVTIFSSTSYLKETPSALMKEKSPKPGKKIFLQRITFLWKRLPFRYKSSFRNIFRQKKNLILTSLSIIGSTLLVLIGFALFDASSALKEDALFGNVASTMGIISMVIILFAVAMAIVVIYSLANMNIADRQRELATLKVLGYHDYECSFYTFREIMIISVLAVIIGIPLSTLVVAFVLQYLDFGTINDVKWYSYLGTFGIIIVTTLLVNLLLYPKIKAVNMNDSLKVLD